MKRLKKYLDLWSFGLFNLDRRIKEVENFASFEGH
jgi:hypothetical protein